MLSRIVRRSLTSRNVQRPQKHRKPHVAVEPHNVLQEEFTNIGDANGSGLRLFDHAKTASIINSLPTISEKISFVSPYEREWTRAEKTWRREWHPNLSSPRKAWALPPIPAYHDSLSYYLYLTKSRLVDDSLDMFYRKLNLPTLSFEKNVSERLRCLLESTRFDSENERVDAILSGIVDEALSLFVHNVAHISKLRVGYDEKVESFWVRSGFGFLYEKKDIVSGEVKRDPLRTPKFTGDDRRKLGELAFVYRDQFSAQLRSSNPLAPHVTETPVSEDSNLVFEDKEKLEDILLSPRVFNLWPDGDVLWQCPGYHADAGEVDNNVRLSMKSLHGLGDKCSYWGGDAQSTWDACAKSQAIISLFSSLNAQAHCQGFTQYTDITRPFSSQMILSDGKRFVFAVGQLNTIAINIECEGFKNDKSNVAFIEKAENLYDKFENGVFYHKTSEGLQEGLNERVLQRVLQMICRD